MRPAETGVRVRACLAVGAAAELQRLLTVPRVRSDHCRMSGRQYSFTLARSGLKPGYYVPVRLRIVDTVTILSGVPIFVAAIALAMASARWAGQIGLGVVWREPAVFFVCLCVMLLAAIWILWLTAVAALRLVFRITGMMTKAEARYYPLRADKRCVDPWPEAWQKAEVGGAAECDSGPTA